MMAEQFRAHAVTHPGTVRGHNEDMFVDRSDIGLWAVADGAGGHQAGEVASDMIAGALGSIPGKLDAEATVMLVRQRLTETHVALQEQAARQGDGAVIASTVVVLVVRHGHYGCLWAGDSRAYLLRNDEFRRLTRDHSLVQELVDAGHLRPQDAERHPRANVITRAVGAAGATLELDMVTGRIMPGDRFLLCTDGLSKAVDDAALAQIMRGEGPDLAAERLLSTALARRARDNVTAVVLEVGADGPV
jgi:protein phosphatase/serine/threonine-protein phosphatase Stp1